MLDTTQESQISDHQSKNLSHDKPRLPSPSEDSIETTVISNRHVPGLKQLHIFNDINLRDLEDYCVRQENRFQLERGRAENGNGVLIGFVGPDY
mmetsp:Transcript_11147/g.25824  ORF Transcript_11147/g.25824 Transcript_11147/m.25824 type:complete len:94 (-) Transcript_11147:355-636(-)